MKTIEKVPVTDEEHAAYKKACEELSRSMRGQTALLIREFLKSLKNNKNVSNS
jgi:hypothetical protein